MAEQEEHAGSVKYDSLCADGDWITKGPDFASCDVVCTAVRGPMTQRANVRFYRLGN